LVKSAAPCANCAGRGIVEVPATEGRGDGLYRLCAVCHNAAGIRAPLSTAATPTLRATDVSGERREAAKAAPRVSFQEAIAKRQSAADAIDALVQKNIELARDAAPGARERALSRVLKSAEGRRLYALYDEAAHLASRSF
jgi:hypothetical protein